MSWDGSSGSEVTIAASGSESARFGHSVERLTVGSGWRDAYTSDELAAELRRLLAASNAHTVILRYPTDAPVVARAVGDSGRTVYPAGSLLYWERGTDDAEPEPGVTVVRSPGISAETLASIRSLIADSFRGYINHYSANPLMDERLIAEGYLEWAESTVLDEDNRVFLLDVDGMPAGVATVESPPGSEHWEIQLAGMKTDAQGRGDYARLVRGVLASARAEGAARVVISTQAHNVRVQRAWARLGFVPFGSIDTVHLVRGVEA